MTDRIRWTDNGYRGFLGYAGTLPDWMYQVWEPDRGSDEWILQQAAMAGRVGKVVHGVGADELKARAEELLAEFVSALGAVFPDQVRADERRKCAGIIRRAAAHLAGDDQQMRAYRESAMTMADLIDAPRSEEK